MMDYIKFVVMTGLLLHLWGKAQAQTAVREERSESFVIYAYDKSYKVVAPERFATGVTAVLENKTLIPLRGKFQKRDGTLIKHVALAPQSLVSVDLKLNEGELAYFVPFTPAFQEVELRFGQRAYEIPPLKSSTLR